MESIRINVLESYDPKFCCVCVQNGDDSYLNVFENVISYQNVFISLAQIINDTLGLHVQRNNNQPEEICVNCKTKTIDFYIFKRRNEENRRIYEASTSSKNNLMQFVEQLESMPQYTENLTEEPENIIEDSEIEVKEEIYESQELEIDEDSVHEDFCDAPDDDRMVECREEHVIVTTEAETETTAPKTKAKAVRKSNPDSWKRNTRKLAKNTGKSYIASNGKYVEAKRMKDSCGSTCRMHCEQKISDASRLINFETFYKLADIAKQRRFLFEHMKTFEPRQHKNSPSRKPRNVQRNYFLEVTHPNGAVEMVQVCKLLFLNTFAISSQMIDTLHGKPSPKEDSVMFGGSSKDAVVRDRKQLKKLTTVKQM